MTLSDNVISSESCLERRGATAAAAIRDSLTGDGVSRASTRPYATVGADAGVADLIRLRNDVRWLLADCDDAEESWSQWLCSVAPVHRLSARNLLHYWAIRQRDLRSLQARLAGYGLSSLGRSEPHVRGTLTAVHFAIDAMLDSATVPLRPVHAGDGERLLSRNANALLGPCPVDRAARIMVTLPPEAATNPDLVRELIDQGMDVARINCAHDDADAWRRMARHVRDAAASAGRNCLIAMDLAGPKLRTGELAPGPRCLKLRPHRDAVGRVLAPARAWLTSSERPAEPPEPDMPVLPVDREWLTRRRGGEVVVLRDGRESKRRIVLETSGDVTDRQGMVGTIDKTTYLVAGTELCVEGTRDATALGDLPPTEQKLVLESGDLLEVTSDCSPAPVGLATGARIGCTLPEVFDGARVGDAIHFDDGKLSGRIIAVAPETLSVRIDHPARGSAKLRAGKGINVPDTELNLGALTKKDIADLVTVAEVADIVEMSFVRTAADVESLLEELGRIGDDGLGVVLKIETRQGFENLPQLLLTAMHRDRVGVMIARGDLAVECGFERLAELQEEILWLCEAAHLPVIWATQVLEQCVETGLPTRAEISDAAMSERAECVMLNKGRYVADAVAVLNEILCRMTDHHYKKTALLRQLRSWHGGADHS